MATTNIKIHKVNSLPAVFDASALYMVKSAHPDHFDFYISTADGTAARHILNKDEIQGMIDASVGFANAPVKIANTIADRNALNPIVNTQVLVLDATGDATVANGAATYIYDVATFTWYKITEHATLTLTYDWNSLTGKPVSSVASIDDAVAKRHSHANQTTLALLGQDVNGALTFNGEAVKVNLTEEAW